MSSNSKHPLTALLAGRMCAPRKAMLTEHLATDWDILTWSEDEAFTKFVELAPRADVIVAGRIQGEWPLTPNLKLYQIPSTGINWIKPEDAPSGCTVCNSYGHEIAIAEYVLAATLEWEIGLGSSDRLFRKRGWKDRKPGIGPNHGEVFGKTIGIVGYGHIGREVATRARAFGMEVVAVSRTVRPAPELTWYGAMADLKRLLEVSDFVVLTLPLTEETRGLIDVDRIASMKPEAVIINVGRGLVIDEDALYSALIEKRIGGAVLDVWFQYPTAADPDCAPSKYPFEALDNVIMTPHSSASTDPMRERRWAEIVQNLDRFARGERLENVCFEGIGSAVRDANDSGHA
jgi:phosphoglycerate dehydrogenase-like enzyme